MEFTHNYIEIDPSSKSPADLLRRHNAGDIWLVPFTPFDFISTAEWRCYRRGEFVHIPLFPYLTADRPVDMLGFAVQLGVVASQQLKEKDIRRFHLSLGRDANQIQDTKTGETVWQFYLGIGVLVV